MKCSHNVENVLEYCGTVILQLNSDLVFHDELHMKINQSLHRKQQILIFPFINVFGIVPAFSFFGGRRIHFCI